MSEQPEPDQTNWRLTEAERESLKHFLKMAVVFMVIVAITAVVAAFVTAWINNGA